MRDATDIVFEFDTSYGHYQVVDMVYDGRSARVLFSGDRRAAQSGVATDDKPDLLFDYNQRMYELVTGIEPRRLLLIGGGMCTLPAALLADMLDIQIDVVELDDELEVVARRYFGIPDSSRLNIIHSDGLAYLASNQNRYDMIIVDAFTHDLAEPTLSSSDAIAHLTRSLNSGGVLWPT
jgi:spermidine synthase